MPLQADAGSLSATASTPDSSMSGMSDRAQVSEAYGKLPLSFEANEGQTDGSVKFLARGQGYGLFLTATEAVLALSKSSSKNGEQAVVRMSLLKANAAPHVEGQDELIGKSNYFIGNDPQKWRTNVANYSRVQYENVYNGIDLVYYGNQRALEYDFVVAPGSDPKTIALGFEGVAGLKVDKGGDLVLGTAGGEIRQHKPVVYQEVDGARREIAASYVLRGEREVGFEVGEYDATRPLVIDPVLSYSTYLGGSGSDTGYGIDVDAKGSAYITGTTLSNDFPVANALQATRPKYGARASYNDAFITKLNPAGTALLYSTYLGGGIGAEIGKGIAVDSAGNAYVTGVTGGGAVTNARTNDFPVMNPFQPTFGGTDDAFVTKLNATGSAIIYSTYLGGSSSDNGEKIVVNETTGDAYVTGGANSRGFPTTPGAYKQSICATCANGTTHAYVTKFNATGTVQWSTLIGQAYAYDIALDSAGNTYLTGTAATNFPITPGAFQEKHGGGTEAFVTKLNAQGSDLVYSTFLGGGIKSDQGFGIAVDATGSAYVTGQTQNGVFPVTPGAYDISLNGGEDAFVTKFNATGTELVYSTFLGGSGKDSGRSIGLDNTKNVYVTGQTTSINFPLKNSLQIKVGTNEIFLTKLNAAGNALTSSTFLGWGDGLDLAVTGAGVAYLTGKAIRIPVTLTAFQTAKTGANTNSNYDAFVMKVTPANEAVQIYSISGHVTDEATDGYTPVLITLSGKQNRTTTLNTARNYSFGALPPGAYTVTASVNGFTFDPPSQVVQIVNSNQTADFTVVGNENPVATLTSPATGATFTTPANITVTANASDSDGSIAEVEFYASTTSGTVTIGTDTTAPYSVTWTNAPAGNHVIGAIVTDNLGGTGQSDYAHITVKSSVAPTVTMTSPANGFTSSLGDNITVSANVSSASTISYIEFLAGTTPIARLSNGAPYTFQWRPTEAGTYSLTAKAYDTGGQVGTASPLTVTVTPAMSRLYGRIFDGDTVGMSGVTLQLTGTRTASVVTGADGSYSFANLPADGSYRVTPSKAGYKFEPVFFETDFLGYYDRLENFTGVRHTPVSTMITSPSWFAQFTAPAPITINAEASSTAGSISKVEFYANGASGQVFIGTDTTAPYSFTWNNAPAGDYSLFVIATDSTGATSNPDYTPITVHPAPSMVRIAGQVTDGGGSGMSGLRLTLSGSETRVAVTNSGGYYGFGNLPSGGNYTVNAPANYTFTPPSVTFNNLVADELSVDFNTTSFNSAPTVSLTSPATNLTVTAPADITVSANASDSDGNIVRVNFYARTATFITTLGSDTIAPYGLVWGATKPGTYTVTAEAIDNAGRRTVSAPITVTIEPAPQASNISPVMGLDDMRALKLSDGYSAASFTGTGGKHASANLFSMNGLHLAPSVTGNVFNAPTIWTISDLNEKASGSARTLVIQLNDASGTGGQLDALSSNSGAWYISETPGGLAFSEQWNPQSITDIAVRGDYDGDGKTDLAIYRPSDGSWYVLTNPNSNS